MTDDISIQIIGGNKFHPKVIWCDGYGAYIGSANLTQSAWKNNIECGLWLTQKELEDNDLIDSLDDFFKFIEKESKLLNDISVQDILKLKEHKQLKEQKQNNLSNSEAFLIIRKNFGIFNGCSKENNLNIELPSDNETYREDSGWNDLNEMRCFLILKKLKEEDFPRGMRSKLCKEISLINGVNLTPGTIGQKVQNYEYIDTKGKKGLKGYSSNTKRIYQKYNNTSISVLEKRVENLYFFEELRKELKKRKEMEGLEISKAIGKDYNGTIISVKSLGYKGSIKIYRPENNGNPYLEVCYTYHSRKVIEKNKKEINNLKEKFFYLINRREDKLYLESDSFSWNDQLHPAPAWRPFQFTQTYWKTKEEDKQWIVDRVIDLLKALKKPE